MNAPIAPLIADPSMLAALRDKAGAASALLKALGHPNRLLLLCLLVEQDRSVGAL